MRCPDRFQLSFICGSIFFECLGPELVQRFFISIEDFLLCLDEVGLGCVALFTHGTQAPNTCCFTFGLEDKGRKESIGFIGLIARSLLLGFMHGIARSADIGFMPGLARKGSIGFKRLIARKSHVGFMPGLARSLRVGFN